MKKDIFKKNLKLFGFKASLRSIEKQSEKIVCIYLLKPPYDEKRQLIASEAEARAIPIIHTSEEEVAQWRIFPHDGIQTQLFGDSYQFSSLKSYFKVFPDNPKPLLFMILDCVQNATNVGAIFRTCEHFNVDAVITTKARSAELTGPAVAKSSGSLFKYVPHIQVANLAQTMKDLKKKYKFWIYSLDIKAKELISEHSFKENTAFVLGNEAFGIRLQTKIESDYLLKIPHLGPVGDSLNVSVAAAISIYEFYRQKKIF